VQELERSREGAERTDAQALAASIRTGKPDPGPLGVEKLEADLKDAKRHAQAAAVLYDEELRAFRALVSKRRDAWTGAPGGADPVRHRPGA